MIYLSNITLYLLQSDLFNAFNMKKNAPPSAKNFIILALLIGGAFLFFVIFNKIRGNSSGKSGSPGSSSGASLFSGFALSRIAKNAGLNSDQKKMLNYVFKTDQVTDFENSINNPVLLDRHFRRAYRIIEQNSGTESDAQQKLAVLFSTRNLLDNNNSSGVTSTNKLKIDTQLTMDAGKEKYSVTIISTTGDHLTVDAPTNAVGSIIELKRGTIASCILFTRSNKGYRFETRVIGYSTTFGRPSLLLAHSNQVKMLSQRRFRRRQAVIPCNIFMVHTEGSGKKQKLVVDKRYNSGSIADISVGGCSIKIKLPINVGTLFKIEYNQGMDNMAALGQVLRTNRTGINTILHIKFLKVSRKTMNAINAFVYEYINDIE